MSTSWSPREVYLQNRQALLTRDRELAFDRGLGPLNETEEQLDAFVRELRDGVIGTTGRALNPARDFAKMRHFIESSRLFDLLRVMPKGGALHAHTVSVGSARWITSAALEREDCYVCWSDDEAEPRGTLGIFSEGQAPEGFVQLRSLVGQEENFEEVLVELLSMFEPGPPEELDLCLQRISGFVNHVDVFEDYYRDAVQRLIDDGVQYLEMRSSLEPLLGRDGERVTGAAVVERFAALRESVREDHPGFDMRLILSERRAVGGGTSLWASCEQALELAGRFPELIAGYELIGDEDEGPTTFEFIDDFLRFKKQREKMGVSLPFIFFDGDSRWPRELNLYDAVLLGAKRVSHGRNIFRSPAVEAKMRELGVAVESALISDLMLGYSHDLRVHQSRGYIVRGVPVVLSGDDSALLRDEGLSYNFWLACVSWMLDLRGLKQLAVGSLQHSLLPDSTRDAQLDAWRERWEAFVTQGLAMR